MRCEEGTSRASARAKVYAQAHAGGRENGRERRARDEAVHMGEGVGMRHVQSMVWAQRILIAGSGNGPTLTHCRW